MIFVNRAGNLIGRPDRFQKESRQRRISGHFIGQRIHRRDIVIHTIKFLLCSIPLLHQNRVARRGTNLKSRADRCHSPVIGLRVANGLRTKLLQFVAVITQRRFQAIEFGLHVFDLGPDKGPGLRHAGQRLRAARNIGRRRSICPACIGHRGRVFSAGILFASQSRPKGL